MNVLIMISLFLISDKIIYWNRLILLLPFSIFHDTATVSTTVDCIHRYNITGNYNINLTNILLLLIYGIIT